VCSRRVEAAYGTALFGVIADTGEPAGGKSTISDDLAVGFLQADSEKHPGAVTRSTGLKEKRLR